MDAVWIEKQRFESYKLNKRAFRKQIHGRLGKRAPWMRPVHPRAMHLESDIIKDIRSHEQIQQLLHGKIAQPQKGCVNLRVILASRGGCPNCQHPTIAAECPPAF